MVEPNLKKILHGNRTWGLEAISYHLPMQNGYREQTLFYKKSHVLLKEFGPFSDFAFESEVLYFSHRGYGIGFFVTVR